MAMNKATFLAWLHSEFEGLEVEYRFHPTRRWRFDVACPKKSIAIEYEGLIACKSRHLTLAGYSGDCEKYNAAQSLGWRVYRFTPLMINRHETIDFIRGVLTEPKEKHDCKRT